MVDADKKNTARIMRAGSFLLLLQVVMFIGQLYIYSHYVKQLPPEYSANIAMNTLGTLLSLLIHFSILRGKRFERVDVLLLATLVVTSCYMISDASFWVINGNPELWSWNLTGNLVYSACPILLGLILWYLLDEWVGQRGRLFRIGNFFVHLFSVMHLLFLIGTVPGKYFFYVSKETGLYSRGPYYKLPLFLMAGVLGICFVRVLLAKTSVIEKVILALYALIPFLDAVVQASVFGPSLLTVETFCSVFFLYTNIYVRRERRIEERDRILAENRLQILQMQINPHFFYNTLASVASLCETDPREAQEMVYRLCDYLQDNFTTITKPSMISFEEELMHLRHYLSIENMRFPQIQVHYDIACDQFRIPNQTLQPLVENSIRHGIRKRRESKGNIYVRTEERAEEYAVLIRDDGVGFTGRYEDLPGRHIGIANVRSRLTLLCKGTLNLSSVPGESTTCEILLPKEDNG